MCVRVHKCIHITGRCLFRDLSRTVLSTVIKNKHLFITVHLLLILLMHKSIVKDEIDETHEFNFSFRKAVTAAAPTLTTACKGFVPQNRWQLLVIHNVTFIPPDSQLRAISKK